MSVQGEVSTGGSKLPKLTLLSDTERADSTEDIHTLVLEFRQQTHCEAAGQEDQVLVWRKRARASKHELTFESKGRQRE